MMIAILDYAAAHIDYRHYTTNPSAEEIEEDLAEDYSLDNISWSQVHITCESCKFWNTTYSAYCTKGATGVVTEFLEFGCTLHQLKEE